MARSLSPFSSHASPRFAKAPPDPSGPPPGSYSRPYSAPPVRVADVTVRYGVPPAARVETYRRVSLDPGDPVKPGVPAALHAGARDWPDEVPAPLFLKGRGVGRVRLKGEGSGRRGHALPSNSNRRPL